MGLRIFGELLVNHKNIFFIFAGVCGVYIGAGFLAIDPLLVMINDIYVHDDTLPNHIIQDPHATT